MKSLSDRISALTPQQRAALEARLNKRGKVSALPHVIAPRNQFNFAPLSIDQERLWFIDQLQPGNVAYNIYTAKRLVIPLDKTLVERSINEIVRRHEILRTTFEMRDGVPVQVVGMPADINIPLVNLCHLPPAEREAEAMRLTAEEFKRPFDLARGPLLRVTLLKLADEEHIMLINMHHTVTDRWSLDVFERELFGLYQAFSMGAPSPFPPLPVQYADYAHWQRQWLQGETLEALVAYWKEQLWGAPPLLRLPTSYPRPSREGFHGAKESLSVGSQLFETLKELSRREGVTMFMTLLAAFKTLLYRYTGQEDILVGAPIANRDRPELEGVIGYLLNVLVLRTEVSGDISFSELIQRVHKVSRDAYGHQMLPFGKLVEELNPERNLSYNPLYQVGYIFLDFPDTPARAFLKQVGNIFEIETGVSRLDLTLSLTLLPDGITGFFEYNTDLFDSAAMVRMVKHFGLLLEAIAAHPERRLCDLPLLTEDERTRIDLLDATGTAAGSGQCVHELFEQQVKRAPDAPALSFAGQQLTYRELNERANRLAHYLLRLGLRPDQAVGILLDRSTEMYVGILAILKAGGAYVPLDASHPAKRIGYILKEAQVVALLTRRNLAGSLPLEDVRVVWVDDDAGNIERERSENPRRAVFAENLAYIIYTSGSTGSPRGVMIEHGSLANLFAAMRPWLALHETESWSLFHSYTFDVSVWEFWGALLSGGRLTVVPSSVAHSPVELHDLLREQRVSILSLTPSALLLHVGSWEKCAEFYRGLSLRRLLVGGEPFPAELARQTFPEDMEVWNFYGPTEATVWASVGRIRTGDVPVPLGRPIGGLQLYVLDKHLQIVPTGVIGELYLGGRGLARGYLQLPEMTAEKFIPHPYGKKGARLYRTGDLARYLPDGEIEFMGRSDSQVKLRGFRIELGEIEATLRRHEAVRDAVVMLREDRGTDKRLIAYVVPATETGRPAIGELRSFLKDRLPEYMLPAAFVMLNEMPLSSSGKVNRHALPAPDGVRGRKGEASAATPTPVEEMLIAVWKLVLGLDGIAGSDNFFELGGHSLLATQIVSRVREAFHVELPLHRIFESPRLADMAEDIMLLLREGKGELAPPISPASRNGGALPLSFAQQRMWFLDQLEPGNPAYNISAELRMSGQLKLNALKRSLREIVRRHEVLRTTFKTSNGLPFQVVDAARNFMLPVVDLTALPGEMRQGEAQRLASEETRRGFDLERGPVQRMLLLRNDQAEHTLLLTVHHIAFDGWSIGVFCRELATLYKAFSAGASPELPELRIQYADFAHWQREWIAGAILEEQLGYWKQQLKAPLPVLELPTDRRRVEPQNYENGYAPFALPDDLSESLRELSRRESVTLFMTLLAAFQVFLYLYTRQTEMVLGTIVAGRNRRETEPLLGFFANPVLLRAGLSPDLSFSETLRKVREVSLEAYAHQDAPFEMVVEMLRPERTLSHLPLFQVAFAFLNVDLSALELPGITTSSVILENDVMRVDLTLSLVDTTGAVIGKWRYNAALFNASTIARMHRHFETLLRNIIADPAASLDALTVFADEDADSFKRETDERLSAELKSIRRKSIVTRTARPDADRQ